MKEALKSLSITIMLIMRILLLGGGYRDYWWNAEERRNFTDLNDNVLSLAPESYLEETGIGADILEYTEAKLSL